MIAATSRRRPTSGVGGVGSCTRTGAGAVRCRERGIVAQDPALQLLELRAGVHAELFDEQLTGGPAGGERVGLPSRAVER